MSRINIATDELITLSEAAALVPGKRPCPMAIFRWHKYGKCGHRLETVKITNRVFTTKAALMAFLTAVGTTPAEPSNASQRRAKARLDARKV